MNADKSYRPCFRCSTKKDVEYYLGFSVWLCPECFANYHNPQYEPPDTLEDLKDI